VFTLNGYSGEDVIRLGSLVADGAARYLAFQGEIGGVGGNEHLQGCVVWNDAKLPRLAGDALQRPGGPRPHVEVMRGTLEQAVAYCSKPDTRAPPPAPQFAEFGERPRGVGRQGSRSDWDDIRDHLSGGGALAELAQTHPGHIVRYHGGLQTLQGYLKPQRREWKTEVHWYYGPTGTGKSRYAFREHPDAYQKMGGNKWWDGYDGHECVIVDDYRRDLCPFHELLRLLDRYPMRVEFKGGSREFVARTLIITTPYSPRDTWEGQTEEHLAQLIRRIDVVRNFSVNPYNPDI